MNFDFIVETQDSRSINRNKSAIIRKNASKIGAISRKKLGDRRVNTLQIPDFLLTPGERDEVVEDEKRSSKSGLPKTTALPTHIRNNKSDLSDIRNTFLTVSWPISDPYPGSFHALASIVNSDLQSRILQNAFDSSLPEHSLRAAKTPYLVQDVILRKITLCYGQVDCLDNAIQCVWEKMRSYLLPVSEKELAERKTCQLYGRALEGLQSSLFKPSPELATYLWFATVLLVLYELLDTSYNQAFVWHTRGSGHLLNFIGPKGILSDTQKTVLASQSAAMITEFVYIGEHCFLSSSDWQAALESLMLPTERFTDRSESSISLWMLGARLPGLFQKTSQTICGILTENLEELILQVCNLHSNYRSWWTKWNSLLDFDDVHLKYNDEHLNQRVGILTTFLEHFIIVTRLVIAMDPVSFSEFEFHALTSSNRLLQIYKELSGGLNAAIKLRLTMAKKVAVVTKSTTSDWSRFSEVSQASPTINPAIFLKWSQSVLRAPVRPT